MSGSLSWNEAIMSEIKASMKYGTPQTRTMPERPSWKLWALSDALREASNIIWP